MKDVSLTLDTTGLARTLRALADFSPVSQKDTLRAEAGSILKMCAARTKVATAQKITINERLRVLRDLNLTKKGGSDISINVGLKGPFGRVWRRTPNRRGGIQQTHEAGFKPLWRHYGDAAWTDIKEAIDLFRSELSRRLPLAKKSAGLARQSWVQIADDMGIRLEDVPGGTLSAAGIAKARAALSSTGQAYVNGQATEYGEARKFAIILTNRLPYAVPAKLDRILLVAIQGRVKFFERNLALGTFDSLEKTLRAYPGLKITRS